jgi:hypothetical protein
MFDKILTICHYFELNIRSFHTPQTSQMRLFWAYLGSFEATKNKKGV